MIALKNITVKYGAKTVVDNVSAEAKTGEFIALIGPNGSGKSSFLKAIAGLIPYSGSTSLPQHAKARARSLSYLAQNSTAPDHRSIQSAAKACATDQFFGRTFGALSGGEQMRVHLSRALATKAPILLADEPTTALDPYYQISVMNILQKESRTDGPASTVLTDDILKTVFRITSNGDII